MPLSKITAASISDNSVTTAKVADDAITGAKIENNPTIAGNLTVSGGFIPSESTSNRNMIINGNMAIHQRAATNSHNDNAVDRYVLVKNNLDTADFTTKHQVITDNPPFSDALEIKCTTEDTSIAANELIRIRMRLEANTLQKLQYGSSSAKSSTLSFWVKSNLTDTFSVALTTQDGTSQNIGNTFTIAQANTWQKVVWNIPGNTSGTINKDNGNGMMLVWGLTVGSGFRGTANTTWGTNSDARNLTGHTANIASSTSNNFYLTGVQWELGDVATPFEHETFGDNLQKCQRYFAKSNSIGTAPGENSEIGYTYTAVSLSGTDVRVPFVTFPVRMRASATVQFDEPAYPLTGGSAGQWHYGGVEQYDTPSASIQRDNGFYCSATVAGASTNSSHWTSGEWTADAEL